MYSGKTTVARQLARHINEHYGIDTEWVDTDQAVEERYHLTVADCFRRYGEQMFRSLETTVLHSVSETGDQNDDSMVKTRPPRLKIISTGGGTPCSGDNMQWMLDHGLVVYLRLGVDAIVKRMSVSHKPRPMLSNMSQSQRIEHIHDQLVRRLPIYQEAHLAFDAEEPDVAAVSQAVVDWFAMRKKDCPE